MNSRTIPDKIVEARYTGKEITVVAADATEVTFTPDGLATFISGKITIPVTSVNGEIGEVVLDADSVGAVAVPETPATYSETASDIAAVLVAAGLMAASEE